MASKDEKTKDVCIDLPKIPWIEKLEDIPSIVLPIIGELKAGVDPTVALPSKCAFSFNLLAQVGPLLGNLQCVVNILGVIMALKDFATSPLTKAPDLITAIDKAVGCITPYTIPHICIAASIHGTLVLIMNSLDCLIELLDSIINFKLKVDLESAEGNPLLEASIKCANANIDASMHNVKSSFSSIQAIFSIIDSLSGIAEVKLVDKDGNKITLDVNFDDPIAARNVLMGINEALAMVAGKLEAVAGMAKKLCVPPK